MRKLTCRDHFDSSSQPKMNAKSEFGQYHKCMALYLSLKDHRDQMNLSCST